MPGGRTSRGRRRARLALPLLLVGMAVTTGTAAGASAPQAIRLPTPVAGVDPLANVDLGLRPDRLRTSVVPGRVHNTEEVTVGIGPTGAPTTVTDRQRLVIDGAGNYIVRELGPARAARGLDGTVPPVLQLGTVIWQGFSPGRRELAALLTLDPAIEAARLPMQVRLTFRTDPGRTEALRPGGLAPAAGTLTITLHNNTTSNRALDTGTAHLAPLARILDRLRRAAAHPRAAVPPVAGAELPRRVPGERDGQTALGVTAPLRVTGTIRAPGGAAAVSGPATTPVATGAAIAGTLTGDATFTVRLARGDAVGMTLDVRPWLDPRTLQPPSGFASWRAWASAGPDQPARRAATTTAVEGAAAAARSAEYSPYLQADAPGRHLSTFTYVVAAAPAANAPHGPDVQPRPGAIAAAAVACLAVLGNAALLRRRL